MCVRARMRLRAYVRVYVCVYACICACMRASVCVCACGVRACVRACVCVCREGGCVAKEGRAYNAGVLRKDWFHKLNVITSCTSCFYYILFVIFTLCVFLLESFPSQILDSHPVIGIHTFAKFDRNEALGRRFYKLNKQSGITSYVGPGPVVTSLDVHVTSVKKSGETLVLFLTSAVSMISEQKNMTTGTNH